VNKMVARIVNSTRFKSVSELLNLGGFSKVYQAQSRL